MPVAPPSSRVAAPATRPSPSGATLRAATLGAVGMACVGGSVAVSGVLTDAPLFTVQALRYGVAATLLVVAARVSGRSLHRPRGPEWVWLAAIACCGLVGFNAALVRGAEHAEPAVLGVAVACAPILLAVAGPLMARRRPRPTVVAAAVTVTVGAVLVQGGGHSDAAGLGWAALVLACEVAFTLLAVPVLGRLGAWGVSAHSCWIAALVLAALGLVTEGPTAVLEVRPAHLLAAAYLAVLVTAMAFVLWYSAVRGLGSASAGLLTGVAPATAAGAGVLLGGPVPGLLAVLGVALVAVGPAVGMGAGRRFGGRRMKTSAPSANATG